MQKQNFSQGGFMPQNRQHHRKAKYPNKVAKPKSLAFVRIFLFRSAGSKITYFPTAPFLHKSEQTDNFSKDSDLLYQNRFHKIILRL